MSCRESFCSEVHQSQTGRWYILELDAQEVSLILGYKYQTTTRISTTTLEWKVQMQLDLSVSQTDLFPSNSAKFSIKSTHYSQVLKGDFSFLYFVNISWLNY